MGVSASYLVGRVEEGQHALLLHGAQNAPPLLGGGVDTGGVVRACMQQNYGALRSALKVLNHALLTTSA